MPETETPLRCTAKVRKISEDGRVTFNGCSSWYQVPAELMPVFREARKERHQVRFTTDRDCTIRAAELSLRRLPPDLRLDGPKHLK